jgi:SsrA-binding protein
MQGESRVSEARSKKVITTNRKARHTYEVLETVEAGLVLTGTEVKSLRTGRASLAEAYGVVRGAEVYLVQMHINPYEQGNRENHDPVRDRKLLLHKRQIDRLRGRVESKGLTIVPLELYFSGPYVKVTLALARGKRQYDRRQDIQKRDADREVRRRMREAQR